MSGLDGWRAASDPQKAKDNVDTTAVGVSSLAPTHTPAVKKISISGRIVTAKDVSARHQILEIEPSDCEGRALVPPGETVCRVHLDMDAQLLSKWLAVRHARRLITVGVSVHVQILPKSPLAACLSPKGAQTAMPDGAAAVAASMAASDFWASDLAIVGVLPTSAYIARLLSFSKETLFMLFNDKGGAADGSTPMNLVSALRPCSVAQTQSLLKLGADEIEAGRKSLLFKHESLLKLCDEMRKSQGWSRRPRAIPPTSAATWNALLRLEEKWCRECDGGDQACARDAEDAVWTGRT
jgi:hypothetical protein